MAEEKVETTAATEETEATEEVVVDQSAEESGSTTPVISREDPLGDIIYFSTQQAAGVKDAIDLVATRVAVGNKDTVDRIVEEKTQELVYDAEAKRISAETLKVIEEIRRAKQEAEKELLELENSKKRLLAEIEELQSMDEKAKAYYDSNKSVLRCIGIKEKLSLTAMKRLMPIASMVFIIFQILLFPFSLIGVVIEHLLAIADGICGKVSSVGWKIALSILTIIVIVGLVVGAVWLCTYAIGQFTAPAAVPQVTA